MNRLKTVSEALNDKQTKQLTEYGPDSQILSQIKEESGIEGIWAQGITKFYPVYAFSHNGTDWFKSKPTAITLDKFINLILGSNPKYVGREIVGIFLTQEDANKVYDALPLREDL